MCDINEAKLFAEMVQPLILSLSQFQFFCFTCYVLMRIIRRILR
jgi:hypothetical protein